MEPEARLRRLAAPTLVLHGATIIPAGARGADAIDGAVRAARGVRTLVSNGPRRWPRVTALLAPRREHDLHLPLPAHPGAGRELAQGRHWAAPGGRYPLRAGDQREQVETGWDVAPLNSRPSQERLPGRRAESNAAQESTADVVNARTCCPSTGAHDDQRKSGGGGPTARASFVGPEVGEAGYRRLPRDRRRASVQFPEACGCDH
jgi:hypothetical protein